MGREGREPLRLIGIDFFGTYLFTAGGGHLELFGWAVSKKETLSNDGKV